MRRVFTFLVASLLLASESAAAPPPLDRIVAVVDEGIITLSQIRARSRPLVRQLEQKSGKPPTTAALESLYAEMLQQMINERLIALEAAPHIFVTAEEIDKGVEQLAQSNKVTVEQLYAEVDRVGLTRDEYRDEIRRQILDGKWTMLAVGVKLRVDRSDDKAFLKALEEGRAKELERLRTKHYIEVRK